jgi:hypothetical protein
MFLVWVWRVTGFCIEPDLVAAFEQLALRVLTSTAITRVGVTRGMTCKRVGGKGSDSWSGRRVWDEENLRPKRVLMRLPI